jgi:predicted transglutaminase-like cysteine proteinase
MGLSDLRVATQLKSEELLTKQTLTGPLLSRPGLAVPPLPVPSLSAVAHRLARRPWRGLLLAACLLAVVLPSPAWDPDRMGLAAQRIGPRAVEGAQALRALVAQAAALDDEPQRLALVNQFFNRRVVFRDDTEVWGQVDYWASPLETLNKGEGDCEDYAIAKYFSLLAAGVPGGRLRMVYVRAQLAGPGGPTQAHMVLAWTPQAGGEPLILDNLVSELRPASRRPDLTPVFSFNAEGLWQGVAGASAGDPAARLSRWREVLLKARAEGFL